MCGGGGGGGPRRSSAAQEEWLAERRTEESAPAGRGEPEEDPVPEPAAGARWGLVHFFGWFLILSDLFSVTV